MKRKMEGILFRQVLMKRANKIQEILRWRLVWWVSGGLLVALVGLRFWLSHRGIESAVGPTSVSEVLDSKASAQGGVEDADVPRSEKAMKDRLLTDLPASPLDELLEPGVSRRQRLEILGHLFSEYHSAMGEIPSGLPQEIFAAFQGNNARGIVYVSEDHPAIGADGVAVNPEGQAIVPHVISASERVFELRDPGADGVHYSEDDLIVAFPSGSGVEMPAEFGQRLPVEVSR